MRSWAVGVLAVAWLASPSGSNGQTLTLNPADPKHAEFVEGRRRVTIEPGGEIRVSSPYSVRVRVEGQNNAFYDCKLTTEPLEVPEVKALQQFLGAAGPYLLEVGQLALATRDRGKDLTEFNRILSTLERGRGVADLGEEIDRRLRVANSERLQLLNTIAALEASAPVRATRALQAELESLDKLIWSGEGLHVARLTTLATLDTMSRTPAVDDLLRDRFRARARLAGCTDGKCDELPLVGALLTEYPKLQERSSGLDGPSEIAAATEAFRRLAEVVGRLREIEEELETLRGEVQKMPRNPENDARSRNIDAAAQETRDRRAAIDVPDPKALSEAAKKALGESNAVLTLAYGTQILALRAGNAVSNWECDAVGTKWDEGRTVTVNIAPRSEPELARLARIAPIAFKAEVQPRWVVSPSVGLALFYARDAQFTTYGTNDVTGGKQIVETGTQDKRVNYGLTLALAWPWIQDLLPGNVRLNLPDLTINPSEDTRALGLGAGLTFGLFKFGSGFLWTKHSALDGQSVGDVVPTLKTRDRYGRSLYFSFSVVGWPPFLKSD
jgi:hypothetical protein